MKLAIFRMPHAVALPLYGTAGAAGFDLTAAIEGEIVLQPGERKLVPTGLKVALPEGTELQIRPRSGLALKHGITVLNAPGTIDCDYRGEIGCVLINHGQEPFVVKRGERIAQGILASYLRADFAEVTDEASLGATDRGAGGFGSTGRS